MPDLLIVCRDNRIRAQLEELGSGALFRVKATADVTSGLEWLKLRSFDIAFVDGSVSVADQQKLGTGMWQKNPVAPLVVFHLDSTLKKVQSEARLFGADLAVGDDAWRVLKESLAGVKPRGFQKMNPFKIMVVEDLDSPRDIVCSYIENMGFEHVEGKRSVKEAISALEGEPEKFSCIVTDIRMPEVSGQKLIEFVRNHEKLKHIPIIALTAYGTVDTLVECLKAGASGFLVKPPRKPDLSRELGRALRISARGASPRLASHDEAEILREILIDRGMI
jgi:DNA-binding NtrC family response regulator